MMIFVVRFAGPFGFIKPWTAVRDELTYSQTFLTPSIVEGLRQKLEVAGIERHRLRHKGISVQQERTHSKGWTVTTKQMSRNLSILKRGVMIQPELSLAFPTIEDAKSATSQHICLCRNEDVLFPVGEVVEMDEAEFELLPGVELQFVNASEADSEAFLVGFNRFDGSKPMYGRLIIRDQVEV